MKAEDRQGRQEEEISSHKRHKTTQDFSNDASLDHARSKGFGTKRSGCAGIGDEWPQKRRAKGAKRRGGWKTPSPINLVREALFKNICGSSSSLLPLSNSVSQHLLSFVYFVPFVVPSFNS